ncbi:MULTISPECIES: alpha/beta hydrolase [Nocardia]|jgi:pimeloyl-ACP methyl ester carboxylesterase|uniref:Alpha/beta hydrolase n=1 Tax=Nocardia nova TaxID=37330 RepID=A0A2T2ZC05_9NOCA|nr:MULTISPECIES: alpha/beta fold hydrolase [Nocardia]PSR65256.1 alpha/beta hydrolase [Nocardia nova]
MSQTTHLTAPTVITFDVTEAIGSGGSLTQTARLFLPEHPERTPAVLVCLAGGTYDWHYWHLDVPARRGYSFAEHLAGRGFAVVAVDHLGVGESSDPTGAGPVGLSLLARGDATVAHQIKQRVAAGTLSADLPALDIPLIGVGHSMGACLTTIVQAEQRPYAAVALLGYGVDIANVYDESNDADDLEDRVADSERVFRELNGVAAEANSCVVPRAHLRAIFHAPDVPEDIVAADDAVESVVPVRAASEVTTPGYVATFAKTIDVPVFIGLGAVLDVSPNPHAEPGNYRHSPDVTLHLVEGSAHCHNFAGKRATLWDRIAAWIPTVTGPPAQTAN